MCASRKLFVGSNKNSVSWCVTFTVIPRRDMLEKVRNCVSSNFCSKNRDISGSLKYLKIINKIILIRKFYFKIGKNFNKDRTLSLLIFLSSRSKKHIISGLRTKTKTASIAESWGNPRYTTLCPGSQCVHRCVYNRV